MPWSSSTLETISLTSRSWKMRHPSLRASSAICETTRTTSRSAVRPRVAAEPMTVTLSTVPAISRGASPAQPIESSPGPPTSSSGST